MTSADILRPFRSLKSDLQAVGTRRYIVLPVSFVEGIMRKKIETICSLATLPADPVPDWKRFPGRAFARNFRNLIGRRYNGDCVFKAFLFWFRLVVHLFCLKRVYFVVCKFTCLGKCEWVREGESECLGVCLCLAQAKLSEFLRNLSKLLN